MSQKFYKYIPFGSYARLSLYMLFKENSVFFSDKKFLNDPTDCNPAIQIDVDDARVRDYAEKIIFEDISIYPLRLKGVAQYIASGAGDAPTISDNYWAWRFYNNNLSNIKEGFSVEHIFAQEIVKFHIEEAKVFSLSRTCMEPKMWAHYADSHKGICLEFEVDDESGIKYRMGDVEYTTKRPIILASEIMAVPYGSDNAAKVLLFNKMFLTKSSGWAYEQESRLFIPKSEEKKGIVTLELPEGEYRRLSSIRVTGIVFGLNVSAENMDLVKGMNERVSKNKKATKSYRISPKENSYDLLRALEDDDIPF